MGDSPSAVDLELGTDLASPEDVGGGGAGGDALAWSV
jgi:hypothetical protein